MFKKIKEKLIFYGFPAVIVVLVYFFINTFSYLNIYPFCSVDIHGNVLFKNEGTIRKAIHIIKKDYPDSYSDLCRYVNVIKEQKCTIRDWHLVPRIEDYTNETGCYVRGSKTIYISPERSNSNNIIQKRADQIIKLTAFSKNFWIKENNILKNKK
jgi:hypothetical protein